jgi:hypothetical protein
VDSHQLTVVRMNDRVPLPRASESNRIRFSAAQGRESDNGQCLNPGHNDCHRLYKAAVTGRAEIPALVLTAAETLLIRSDAVLGPSRRPVQPPGTAPHPHDRNGGDPRC